MPTSIIMIDCFLDSLVALREINPDDKPKMAAIFWSTGLDRAPITPVEKKQGGTSYEDIWSKLLTPDGKNPNAWELEMHEPAKFNRLVLLRPDLFHNPTPDFGITFQDLRLVYLIFQVHIKVSTFYDFKPLITIKFYRWHFAAAIMCWFKSNQPSFFVLRK
jgi:hypothetical protein